MQIAITLSDNKGLESTLSPIFGRCPFFMFIDPETKEFIIEENASQSASGGAGIQAAQQIIDKKAAAVISGRLGPKAHSVLLAASIPAFKSEGGSVEETLEAYKQKKLTSLIEPNADAHSGERNA
jgi:predicted Fe-Mo cluster-binding NifX family protein